MLPQDPSTAVTGCFLCDPPADLTYCKTADGLAISGLGPLVDGYSVVSAVPHVRSAADAAVGGAPEFLPFAERVRSRLIARYGSCLLTEHGRMPVWRQLSCPLVLPHREMLPDCLMRCVTESLPVFNLKSISSWAPVRRRSRRAVSPAQGRGEVRSRRVLRLSDSLDELVVSHGAISPVACSWPLVWLASAVDRSQISACERASRPATTAPL